MCSVSASPVMKITGTLLKPASRLRRRQVSKPSIPGITASSRTMSGVIWSTIRIAAAPSIATITVMPAPSSASVSSRKVSGESSTTSATSRFLASVVIGVQCLQGCHVLIEIEAVDKGAQLRNEVSMLGVFTADLIELDLDCPDVADLSKPDQFLDMFHRRPRARIRFPARQHDLVAIILPFDLEKLADRLQKLWNIDRLHQVAVVEWLRQRRAVRFERARRDHQDARVAVTGRAKGFRHRPTVHAGHRDIEEEQVGPAMCRKRETAGSVGRTQQDEAERCQHFAQKVAVHGIVVGDQDGLARAEIAANWCFDRGVPPRVGDFRQQDLDPEGAADADLARHLDVAAHHACKQAADGKAKAGTGLRL